MAFHNEMKTNEAGLKEILHIYEKLCSKDSATFMRNFPVSEKWRFFIDGNQQKKGKRSFYKDHKIVDAKTRLRNRGWIPFEKRETNYLKALLNILPSLTNFSQKIDIEYLLSLHLAATLHVENLKFTHQNNSGAFRTTQGIQFRISQKNSTVNGLTEILDKIEKEHKTKYPEFGLILEVENIDIDSDSDLDTEEKTSFLITHDNIDECRKRFGCENNQALAIQLYEVMKLKGHVVQRSTIKSDQVQNEIKKIINDYIETYEQELKEASNDPIKKIRCIAKFIQDCEQLHPFGDANCRTFCMLLLNQLLMRNGFPPVILPDPNRFDAYSIEELVSEIIIGMDNTLLVAQGKKDLYGVTTQEIQEVATEEELKYAELLGLIPIPTASTSVTNTRVGLFSGSTSSVKEETKPPLPGAEVLLQNS